MSDKNITIPSFDVTPIPGLPADFRELISTFGIVLSITLLLIVILTIIVFRKTDPFYKLSLICIQVFSFIAIATWGKGILINAYVSIYTDIPIALNARFEDTSDSDMIYGIIGLLISGIFAVIFMSLKYGLEKLDKHYAHQGSDEGGPPSVSAA